MNGPCNSCGRGSMCKFKVGTISGCSEWLGMPQEARPAQGVSEQGAAQIPTKAGQAGGKAGEKRGKGPNKTEAAYYRECLAGRDARYEAVSFRIAGKHRYTPDFTVFDRTGRLTHCYEVKNGAYKHASHGRARLAFDQARIEYPGIAWIWAVKTKAGWAIS